MILFAEWQLELGLATVNKIKLWSQIERCDFSGSNDVKALKLKIFEKIDYPALL